MCADLGVSIPVAVNFTSKDNLSVNSRGYELLSTAYTLNS